MPPSPTWINRGNLRGPQGIPGANGANGTNGAPGATGPAGATGPQGSSGVVGYTWDMQTQTTGPVTSTTNWQALSAAHPIAAGDSPAQSIFQFTAWGDLATNTAAGGGTNIPYIGVRAFGLDARLQARFAAGAMVAQRTMSWALCARFLFDNDRRLSCYMTGVFSNNNENLNPTNPQQMTIPFAAANTVVSGLGAGAWDVRCQGHWSTAVAGQQMRGFGSMLERWVQASPGNALAFVGPSPPAAPAVGALWLDTSP
jgi:hypothetical protein